MSFDRATKRPWYADGLLFIGADDKGNGRGGFHLNFDRPDGTQEYDDEEADDNLALIVAAVNSFEQLKKACFMAKSVIQLRNEHNQCMTKGDVVVYEMLEEALAAAKGEQ